MFTKINKVEDGNPEIEVANSPVSPSLLSSDLITMGDLKSSGEVQIDGTHTGNIRVEGLTLGAPAEVVGDVFASRVRIHGKLTGNINAKVVSLSKTAYVVGDILHQDISIEQGAYLDGHCRRTEADRTRRKESENPISMLVKSSSKSLEAPKKREA